MRKGLTRQDYIAVKAKIDRKIEKLEADLEEANKVLAEEQRILEEIKKISRANLNETNSLDGEPTEDAPEKPKPHALTRALVETFIDSVYVYDMEHIEIVFTCEDVMKKAMDRVSDDGGKADDGKAGGAEAGGAGPEPPAP